MQSMMQGTGDGASANVSFTINSMESMVRGAAGGANARSNARAMMQNYTSSFSLSELGGVLNQEVFSSVCVTCFEKTELLIEHRRGVSQQMRLHLESGQSTRTIVCAEVPDEVISFYFIDGSHPEDWGITGRCSPIRISSKDGQSDEGA